MATNNIYFESAEDLQKWLEVYNLPENMDTNYLHSIGYSICDIRREIICRQNVSETVLDWG